MHHSPAPFADPVNVKIQCDLDSHVPTRILDYPYDRDDAIDHSHHVAAFWPANDPIAAPHRGSYLSELYDDRMKVDGPSSHDHDAPRDHGPSPYHTSPSPHHMFRPDWHENTPTESDPNADQAHFYRRASFPQVRNDNHDALAPAPTFLHSEPGAFLGPYSSRSDAFYGEPMPMPDHMPLSADPSALHGHPMDDPYLSSASASPHSSIHEFESDSSRSSPVIVPTQSPFYRSNGPMQHAPAYLNPHAALPVMHTDDAASKETQYLRRRCFNCHTTEPPSWRRSTLNPGKIVCNKCGLYERTHLRPRPHRFDELRAGSKARKAAKVAPSPNGSPKSKQDGIKKEPSDGDYDLAQRRGSVTSVGSSGVSEWESGSAYSSSSNPNSGYNSPMSSSFSMPANGSLPHSRPSSRDGPIRLPTAPLTDIATRLTKVPPTKASSAPYYIEGRSTTLGRPLPPSADYYSRRGSLPTDATTNAAGRLASTLGMPEVTGWQVIPPSDLSTSPKPSRKQRKVLAA
ncbi:hypothetical protein K439DRAFT_1643677 [Ramaria rubella]|nr:hypothetical protein K439DRAFT_1643677 [Ramaria rubella]